MRRFPKGPLRLEAMALQARCLSGLGRYREATSAVKALLQSDRPTRKKAQLFRFLGDLQMRQGMCDRAVESFRRAFGLGLPANESSAAKAGIRKCAP